MNKDEFHIEEYKTLKAELLALVDESVKLETFGVAAIAALYAWLASQHIATRAVWWVPVVIPVFGLFRSWLLLRRIEHMSDYIREQIEKKHDCPGWESFFHENPKSKIELSVLIFWVLLIIGTAFAPFVLLRHRPPGVLPKKASAENSNPSRGYVLPIHCTVELFVTEKSVNVANALPAISCTFPDPS